jgi:hypothetical protein
VKRSKDLKVKMCQSLSSRVRLVSLDAYTIVLYNMHLIHRIYFLLALTLTET